MSSLCKFINNTSRGRLFPMATRRYMSVSSEPIFKHKGYQRHVDKCIELYAQNRAIVDEAVQDILNRHRLVLFTEGAWDKPVSLCASNITKMFTLLQVPNVHCVDIFAYPEVFGFLSSKLGEPARNMCFVDANPLGGHDELLALFKSGKLLHALGCKNTTSRGKPLPIANY